jgi:hypothetical protein
MSSSVASLPTQRTSADAGFTPRALPPARLLAGAGRAFAVVAGVGQLIFATYVILLYGRVIIRGLPKGWNTTTPKGFIPGDHTGNIAVRIHVVAAAIILLCGLVQLLPVIRRRWPVAHRWSGRLYVTGLLIGSLAGLLLVVRGRVSAGPIERAAIATNGMLVIYCAVAAWRTARRREFAAHRRWALRAWLAASGVFFFRTGLMAWLLLWRRPVGIDTETFTGPTLSVLALLVYVLLPLPLLEVYFRAERGTPKQQRAVAAILIALAILVAGGTVGATMGLWLPPLRR